MSGNNGKLVQGLDIPIVKLVPRNERKVSKKYYKRIEASLRAVGLIEPLIVYPQGDDYEILDGCLRYRILLDMGVETVPCILGHEREAFTGNRMVNQLSSSQEMRMLRKSLEELDEKTIASVVDKFLVELETQLDEKKVSMHVDDDARTWIAEKGYDVKMGARPMARVIQEHLKKPLANELLFGGLARGGKVTVSVVDGELSIEVEGVAEKV